MATFFFTESSNNIGGQELQLLQQASSLQAQGHQTFVFCRPASRIRQEAEQAGLSVVTVGFRNALHVPSVFQIVRMLRKYKPQAVICHSGHDSNVSALSLYLSSALGLVKPRPRLIRMRTYQPGAARPFLYNKVFDHTLTPSLALRAQLLSQSAIEADKIKVLYPGFNFDQIRADSKLPIHSTLAERLVYANGRQMIVHAAMLRGEKGHGFMLEVVASLITRYPGLLYVIAGEGKLRASLKQQVREKGLDDHVFFAGMVKPVAPLLALADVVVMPSSYEPLGMSQIEALSLAVPVVVSDTGGLPETVRHMETGQVCPPPGHSDALSKWVHALDLYLADPQLARQHAIQGQKEVKRQFDMATQTASLLEYTKPQRSQDFSS
ncbi:MAG: glycosyltransferase [Limnobacter sp.]|nr:glycosyltransferase [Limnobacter sp.]